MRHVSREIIGSFAVKTGDGEIRTVIISQESVSHYAKEGSFSGKHLNLGSIDGPQVIWTGESNIFRLHDGTKLRKR